MARHEDEEGFQPHPGDPWHPEWRDVDDESDEAASEVVAAEDDIESGRRRFGLFARRSKHAPPVDDDSDHWPDAFPSAEVAEGDDGVQFPGVGSPAAETLDAPDADTAEDLQEALAGAGIGTPGNELSGDTPSGTDDTESWTIPTDFAIGSDADEPAADADQATSEFEDLADAAAGGAEEDVDWLSLVEGEAIVGEEDEVVAVADDVPGEEAEPTGWLARRRARKQAETAAWDEAESWPAIEDEGAVAEADDDASGDAEWPVPAEVGSVPFLEDGEDSDAGDAGGASAGLVDAPGGDAELAVDDPGWVAEPIPEALAAGDDDLADVPVEVDLPDVAAWVEESSGDGEPEVVEADAGAVVDDWPEVVDVPDVESEVGLGALAGDLADAPVEADLPDVAAWVEESSGDGEPEVVEADAGAVVDDWPEVVDVPDVESEVGLGALADDLADAPVEVDLPDVAAWVEESSGVGEPEVVEAEAAGFDLGAAEAGADVEAVDVDDEETAAAPKGWLARRRAHKRAEAIIQEEPESWPDPAEDDGDGWPRLDQDHSTAGGLSGAVDEEAAEAAWLEDGTSDDEAAEGLESYAADSAEKDLLDETLGAAGETADDLSSETGPIQETEAAEAPSGWFARRRARKQEETEFWEEAESWPAIEDEGAVAEAVDDASGDAEWPVAAEAGSVPFLGDVEDAVVDDADGVAAAVVDEFAADETPVSVEDPGSWPAIEDEGAVAEAVDDASGDAEWPVAAEAGSVPFLGDVEDAVVDDADGVAAAVVDEFAAGETPVSVEDPGSWPAIEDEGAVAEAVDDASGDAEWPVAAEAGSVPFLGDVEDAVVDDADGVAAAVVDEFAAGETPVSVEDPGSIAESLPQSPAAGDDDLAQALAEVLAVVEPDGDADTGTPMEAGEDDLPVEDGGFDLDATEAVSGAEAVDPVATEDVEVLDVDAPEPVDAEVAGAAAEVADVEIPESAAGVEDVDVFDVDVPEAESLDADGAVAEVVGADAGTFEGDLPEVAAGVDEVLDVDGAVADAVEDVEVFDVDVPEPVGVEADEVAVEGDVLEVAAGVDEVLDVDGAVADAVEDVEVFDVDVPEPVGVEADEVAVEGDVLEVAAGVDEVVDVDGAVADAVEDVEVFDVDVPEPVGVEADEVAVEGDVLEVAAGVDEVLDVDGAVADAVEDVEDVEDVDVDVPEPVGVEAEYPDIDESVAEVVEVPDVDSDAAWGALVDDLADAPIDADIEEIGLSVADAAAADADGPIEIDEAPADADSAVVAEAGDDQASVVIDEGEDLIDPEVPAAIEDEAVAAADEVPATAPDVSVETEVGSIDEPAGESVGVRTGADEVSAPPLPFESPSDDLVDVEAAEYDGDPGRLPKSWFAEIDEDEVEVPDHTLPEVELEDTAEEADPGAVAAGPESAAEMPVVVAPEESEAGMAERGMEPEAAVEVEGGIADDPLAGGDASDTEEAPLVVDEGAFGTAVFDESSDDAPGALPVDQEPVEASGEAEAVDRVEWPESAAGDPVEPDVARPTYQELIETPVDAPEFPEEVLDTFEAPEVSEEAMAEVAAVDEALDDILADVAESAGVVDDSREFDDADVIEPLATDDFPGRADGAELAVDAPTLPGEGEIGGAQEMVSSLDDPVDDPFFEVEANGDESLHSDAMGETFDPAVPPVGPGPDEIGPTEAGFAGAAGGAGAAGVASDVEPRGFFARRRARKRVARSDPGETIQYPDPIYGEHDQAEESAHGDQAPPQDDSMFAPPEAGSEAGVEWPSSDADTPDSMAPLDPETTSEATTTYDALGVEAPAPIDPGDAGFEAGARFTPEPEYLEPEPDYGFVPESAGDDHDGAQYPPEQADVQPMAPEDPEPAYPADPAEQYPPIDPTSATPELPPFDHEEDEVDAPVDLDDSVYTDTGTIEHKDLAALMAHEDTQETELQAVSAHMEGVGSGVVGFEDVRDLGHGGEYVAPPPSDLGMRVLTGVTLLALLLGALWAGGEAMAVFIGAIMLLGLVEFYTTLQSVGYRPLTLVGVPGGAGLLVGTWFLGLGAVPGAIIAVVVLTYFLYAFSPSRRDALTNGGLTALGVAWVTGMGAFAFPIVDTTDFRVLVLALAAATVAMDVGAYFSGKAWGSRPLAPVLSPNKTIEGLAGGTILCLGAAIVMGMLFDPLTIRSGAALGLVVAVAAPLGDLAESLVKRSLGVKDMGAILPGHGGILDRIDAFLFVLPAVWALYELLGFLV